MTYLKGCGVAWGRDPPDAKYGFEDEVSFSDVASWHEHLISDYSCVLLNRSNTGWSHLKPSSVSPFSSRKFNSYFAGFKNKDVAFLHKEGEGPQSDQEG